jgi:hypothetical protein
MVHRDKAGEAPDVGSAFVPPVEVADGIPAE